MRRDGTRDRRDIGRVRRASRAALLAFAAVACACGGSKPPIRSARAPTLVVRPLDSDIAAKRAAEAARSPARSHLVGTIARNSIGPFAARTDAGGVVAWIVPPVHGAGQDLVVVPLDADGAPLGDPKVVATLPQEATSLIVRPSGGSHPGWLIAWSAFLDRGESLTVLGLAPDGTARGKPTDVQRTGDHVKWADLVPTARGAVCVWAEETTAGDANVVAAGIDSDGRPRGLPARLARGVVGWAAVRADDGVGLALVFPSTPDDADPGAGTLSWLRLDAEARPLAPPVPIATRPTVSDDVDVVQAGKRWLLAWTDRTGEDAQVMLASVDAAGRAQPPRRAMDTVGGTSLVALASGPAGVALAWEEPRGRARPMRPLHLASVATDGPPAAQPVSSLQIAAGSTPELVATSTGFAVLAPAHACLATDGPGSCAGPIVPQFVRFDARLAPAQSEPFFVGDARAAAAIGWGLRCAADRCFALAATTAAPTPVYTVDLPARTSPFGVPAMPAPSPDAPRVTGVSTIASGQPYTDVAAVRVGAATLVATLTEAVDLASPDRPNRRSRRARGAVIALHAVDDDGQPLADPARVTSRALSIGGLAIAPAGRAEDGAAVAWVAPDDGDAQVHLARVDRLGKRLKEVQLTTAKGDASDVAIAWAGDGWLVAWVDTRDGNGEVYATKVDRNLQRVVHERRITHAPGDAGDVALVAGRDVAWVAWSDPRDSPHEGLGDIHVTTWSTRDAKPVGDDVRVLATEAHSRSPDLALAGDDGAIVGWIEAPPTGVDAPGAAMVARLDTRGHVVGAPQRLPLAAAGRPTSIALGAPSRGGVHAVIARSAGDEVTLDGLAIGADGTPATKPWPLLDLDASGSFDVALALAGGALVYDDMGSSPADHRVRRAAVEWRR